MRNTFLLLIVFLLPLVATRSISADNSKCWGIIGDDKSRPDISCQPLTEKLLLSLRGATKEQVNMAMKAVGRPIQNGLHFLSNARNFSGDVNFEFQSGKVVIITAMVTPSDNDVNNVELIWNERVGLCSDFPGSKKRCNPE